MSNINDKHIENYEWCSCPKCGEKISLVKTKEKEISRKYKLLVIDDDIGIQSMIDTAFSEDKYQVFTAFDAKKGLEILKKENPDLLFLDIKLPDVNGIDLLKDIRKENERIIVIMITAFGDDKDAVRSMKLGASAYITKPFDMNYLETLVQNFL
jgi:DNA-binding response OmpR family regulator